jgi:hypothetical protein
MSNFGTAGYNFVRQNAEVCVKQFLSQKYSYCSREIVLKAFASHIDTLCFFVKKCISELNDISVSCAFSAYSAVRKFFGEIDKVIVLISTKNALSHKCKNSATNLQYNF